MEAQNLRTAEEHTTSQDNLQECAMSQERRTGSLWRLKRKPQTAQGLGFGALKASHQRSILHGGASYGTHMPNHQRKQPTRNQTEATAETSSKPKGPRRDKTSRNDTTKKNSRPGQSSRQKERGPAGLKAEDRARTGPVPCTRVTWVVHLLFRSDRHSRASLSSSRYCCSGQAGHSLRGSRL